MPNMMHKCRSSQPVRIPAHDALTVMLFDHILRELAPVSIVIELRFVSVADKLTDLLCCEHAMHLKHKAPDPETERFAIS